MKATLEFSLPEEKAELNDAIRATAYKAAIDTLYDEVFRHYLKYDNPFHGKPLKQSERDFLNKIWTVVHEHFVDKIGQDYQE